jgi:hypothetical protein
MEKRKKNELVRMAGKMQVTSKNCARMPVTGLSMVNT